MWFRNNTAKHAGAVTGKTKKNASKILKQFICRRARKQNPFRFFILLAAILSLFLLFHIAWWWLWLHKLAGPWFNVYIWSTELFELRTAMHLHLNRVEHFFPLCFVHLTVDTLFFSPSIVHILQFLRALSVCLSLSLFLFRECFRTIFLAHSLPLSSFTLSISSSVRDRSRSKKQKRRAKQINAQAITRSMNFSPKIVLFVMHKPCNYCRHMNLIRSNVVMASDEFCEIWCLCVFHTAFRSVSRSTENRNT